MHTSVRSMSLDLVKYFAEHGVRWTEKNSSGLTAMELAAKLENETTSMEMVDFMLSKTKKRHLVGIGEKLMQICELYSNNSVGYVFLLITFFFVSAISTQRRSLYNLGILLLVFSLASAD
jgi:hypothetical protein